jgi:16S rRNA (guanine527-N7)-methyltransferase
MKSDQIAALLSPYTATAPADTDWPRILTQLSAYLDLILKWNARVNLTAIRTPEEIVRRHFGESLFAASHLGPCAALLDFGSGAGFPGLPLQLLRPDVLVTLAESRARKAAFLHEVVRTLNLPTEIWSKRVESMPASRQFDAVTLRAVDNMDAALQEASHRATRQLVVLGTTSAQYPAISKDFEPQSPMPLPNSTESALLIFRRR